MPTERMPDFGPIKPKRIFEEICERIRNELSAGTLRPGDKLPPERELNCMWENTSTRWVHASSFSIISDS